MAENVFEKMKYSYLLALLYLFLILGLGVFALSDITSTLDVELNIYRITVIVPFWGILIFVIYALLHALLAVKMVYEMFATPVNQPIVRHLLKVYVRALQH